MNNRFVAAAWGFAGGFSLGFAGAMHYQSQFRSLAIRSLAQALDNPAKARGIDVDLGVGIPGWLKLTLVGFMNETLPDIVGHPVDAVAFSRFGGFNLDRRYADFLNPASPSYQCWYGAYLVFDNDHRQHFGFDAAGQASAQDALDALEADQRLVYHSAGIRKRFPDGRLVRLCEPFSEAICQENGQTWHRLTGAAETWSTFHYGHLPEQSSKFGWCYGVVPPEVAAPVAELHPLTYRGEFRVRYEPAWRASCCKFFIYPAYTDRAGRPIDKGTSTLLAAGQAALAGIRFTRKRELDRC